MIRLHPIPDTDHTCPYCRIDLEAKGWYIPGMRNLADLKCPGCGRDFYGDLRAGHGLHYPMLLEQATGIVHDQYAVNWFADWLRDSYTSRNHQAVPFSQEEFRSIKRPVLLNCLDTLYGHCLLKLLNAQYYLDHRQTLDLIILVPHFLRWMVPQGTAAIWTVDLPLKRGKEWNDGLASEIKRRIERFEECWLSVAHSHPHPKDYNIDRFTGMHPFPIDQWDSRLDQPVVTFIWREDRVWDGPGDRNHWRKLTRRFKQTLGIEQDATQKQRHQVAIFAHALKAVFPRIEFAVVGLGSPGGLPNWIKDLRAPEIDEKRERAWCRHYAKSHVVVGVHGSNMLLASAHAGAVVDLMPQDRWGNILQDLLLKQDDCRETMFRYRVVRISISPDELANLVISILRDHQKMRRNMGCEFCRHEMKSKGQ